MPKSTALTKAVFQLKVSENTFGDRTLFALFLMELTFNVEMEPMQRSHFVLSYPQSDFQKNPFSARRWSPTSWANEKQTHSLYGLVPNQCLWGEHWHVRFLVFMNPPWGHLSLSHLSHSQPSSLYRSLNMGTEPIGEYLKYLFEAYIQPLVSHTFFCCIWKT